MHLGRSVAALAIALALACAAPRPARADDCVATPPPRNDAALFACAERCIDARDSANAFVCLERLRARFEAKGWRSPRLQLLWGRASLVAGRDDDAIAAFDRALALPSVNQLDFQVKADAATERGKLVGTLTVTSSPAGALVQLDGVFVGQTPVTRPETRRGHYTVELSKSGFATQSRAVDFVPGAPAVHVELEALRDLAAPADLAEPRDLGAPPDLARPAPVTVPLVTETPKPRNESPPFYKKWWFWTIVGGATLAIVIGGAVGGTANHDAPIPSTSLGTATVPFK